MMSVKKNNMTLEILIVEIFNKQIMNGGSA